ncbi:MAG: hypothetical protein ABIQ95_05445 [Bdellovibrionia bacterium]
MKQLKCFSLKIFFLIGMLNLSASLEIGCSTAKRNPASGNCFNIGKSFGYDDEILMPLCSGITTNESVYCYRDAVMIHHLTQVQAIELCKPRFNIPVVK